MQHPNTFMIAILIKHDIRVSRRGGHVTRNWPKCTTGADVTRAMLTSSTLPSSTSTTGRATTRNKTETTSSRWDYWPYKWLMPIHPTESHITLFVLDPLSRGQVVLYPPYCAIIAGLRTYLMESDRFGRQGREIIQSPMLDARQVLLISCCDMVAMIFVIIWQRKRDINEPKSLLVESSGQ